MSTFDDVADKIRERQCVLFLGAGCSIESRAPSSKKLFDIISDKFIGRSVLARDLTRAFDLACGKDEVNRPKVEEFLWSIIGKLKPSHGHEIMRQFRWPAIFTTNYDQLIETAYSAEDRSQELYPIYRQEGTELELNNTDIVPLFKLFGCISGVKVPKVPDSKISLVLTSKDYVEFRNNRQWMLEALRRLSRANTWLFVGYSFSDGIILNLLIELMASSAWRYQPECYVVLPGITDQDKEYLDTYKMKAIDDSFSDFFTKLDEKYTMATRRILYARQVSFIPKIQGKDIDFIDPKLRLEMDDQFELLDDALIEKDSSNMIFRGYKPSWGDIAKGNDIPRKETKKISDAIYHDLTNENQDTTLYILAAAAGAGKSTVMKRIGYDFYNQGMIVLWLRPYVDWNIDTFQKVYQCFNKRILLLVDDGHLCYSETITLFNQLRSRGIPATVLVAIRKGDYNVLADRRQPFEDIQPHFILPYQLTDKDELRELVIVLERAGFITFDLGRGVDFWLDQFEKRANRIFLVIMMEATRKRRFDEIVLEEYDALRGSLSQRAYEYICATYQYDVPLVEGLLVPVLDCDWQDFLRDIRKGQAELTIVEEGTESVGLSYEARHRLIAKKVAAVRFPKSEQLTNVIENVILTAYPHDKREEEIVLNLLRNEELLCDLASLENRRRIFSKAAERFHDNDQIFLHYGRMLCQENEYEDAEEILELGRKINPENAAIVHYLGILYREKARHTTKRGDTLRVKLYLDAERQFEMARRMSPADEHGYHSHAEMLLDKRRFEAINDDEKDELLNKAWNITSQGLKLVPHPNCYLIEDLHHAILGEGKIEQTRQYFHRRTSTGAGPDTWCLWAKCELEGGFLENVFSIVKDALDKWPENVGLKLVAGDTAQALIDKQGIVNEVTLMYLEKSADLLSDRSDARLRYAVALFQSGKYPESEREFRRAFRLLPDYLPPWYFCHYWIDETGDRRKFIGTAVRQGDRWIVRVSNLPQIYVGTKQVESKRISQGQTVNFNIAFNYYGAAALII